MNPDKSITSPEPVTHGLPEPQGLYDPRHEHDACGMGFVANIKGQKSHDIIEKGIQILINLTHRGACGCDPETGDGAGLLIQIPHKFFAREAAELGFTLPAPGEYGIGMVFLPVERHQRLQTEGIIERIVQEEGLTCSRLARYADRRQRDRPRGARFAALHRADFRGAGRGHGPRPARAQALRHSQARRGGSGRDRRAKCLNAGCSRSRRSRARTIVYKGLLLAPQIAKFYKELSDPDVTSALCLVHQRFSTNTFPTWQLAHPFHYVAHNGEINTVKGNVNWMHARQSVLESDLFGDDLQKLFPIIQPGGSDSSAFDNALELLVQSGRSLPHAMAMLIPEAWDGNPHMDRRARRRFTNITAR